MILRRYLATHALETLKTKKLMVSSPLAFDDIYDCSPNLVYLNEENFTEIQRLMCIRTKSCPIIMNNAQKSHFIEERNSNLEKRSRETMEKYTRICCFENQEESTVNSEARLWHEYTHHKGIRISFDIDIEHKCGIPFFMEKVLYVDVLDKRPPIDFWAVDPSSSDDNVKLVRDIVRYKLSQYEFEHEYRLITTPECCHEFSRDKTDKRKLFDFSEFFNVCTVDFGLLCSSRDILQMFKLLKKDKAYREKKIPMRQVVAITGRTIQYRPISTLTDLWLCCKICG